MNPDPASTMSDESKHQQAQAAHQMDPATLAQTFQQLLAEHQQVLHQRNQLSSSVNELQHRNAELQRQRSMDLPPVEFLPIPRAHTPPASTRPGISHHIKPPKPSKYSRSSSKIPADTWMFEVEQYFSLIGIIEHDHSTRVQLASSLLQEDALVWVQSYARSHDSYPNNITWKDFKNAFLAEFLPVEAEETARIELMALRQGFRYTVQDYVTKFRSLSQRIPSMDETTRKMLFVRGLRDDLQLEILKEVDAPKTLEGVILAATKLETILQPLRHGRNGSYYVPPRPVYSQGRNWNNGRYHNSSYANGYSRPPGMSANGTSSRSANTSAPMELGATDGLNHVAGFDHDSDERDHSGIDLSMFPSELDHEITEDMEFGIVSAIMQNQGNRNPSFSGERRGNYQPKWYKLLPNLTASEELRLFNERKCYICRGSGHRLFRCPKIVEGSFVKRDRINNIQAQMVHEPADDDVKESMFSEFLSKNGFGQ